MEDKIFSNLFENNKSNDFLGDIDQNFLLNKNNDNIKNKTLSKRINQKLNRNRETEKIHLININKLYYLIDCNNIKELKNELNKNQKEVLDERLIKYAIKNNKLKIFNILIDFGYQKKSYMYEICIKKDSHSIFENLINHDVELENENDLIDLCVENNRLSMLKILLNKGIIPNEKNMISAIEFGNYLLSYNKNGEFLPNRLIINFEIIKILFEKNKEYKISLLKYSLINLNKNSFSHFLKHYKIDKKDLKLSFKELKKINGIPIKHFLEILKENDVDEDLIKFFIKNLLN